jgi:hypothetical protein
MADIRINALATTATTPASDDYLALDGTAQGTRKILATNIANNVTDVILGSSGPSVKSSLSARAPRQGLVFDSSHGTTYATVTNIPAFGQGIAGSTSGDFTFAAWVREESTFAGTPIVVIGNAAGGFYCEFNSSGVPYVGVQGGSILLSTATCVVGKTYLLTYTRTGNTGTWYIDGVATNSLTDGINYTHPFANVSFASPYGLHGFCYPLAYNRCLSATEVKALYEAGAPAGADYNSASNTSVVTGFSNGGYTTFSGASATGFTAAAASGSNYVVNTPAGNTQPVLQVGSRVRVSFTATLTSGAAPTFGIRNNVGGDEGTFTVAAGSNSVIITMTQKSVSDGLGNAVFRSTGATSYAISNFSLTYLGLLLAPDAAQAGGGLTWYDTSGNAANITLPASGVSWNVPSSLILGGKWTVATPVDTTGMFNLLPSGGDYFALTLNNRSSGAAAASRRWIIGNNWNNNGDLSFLQSTSSTSTTYNTRGTFAASGNFLIGTTTDSANGKLQLATHTTSAGGIGFGTDTSLYRSQTGMLALDGLTGSLSQLDLRVGGVQKAFVAWNGGDFYLGAVVGTTVIKSSSTTALTLDSSQNATFAGAVTASTAGNYVLQLKDTRSQAADVGASIGLQGTYTGSLQTTFGSILGLKVNSTDGNFAGKLVFQTRPNGGSLTTALTLDDGQNATFAGATLKVSPSANDAAVSIVGRATGTNQAAATSRGATLTVTNLNNTDNNCEAISFQNSNELAIGSIVAQNVSHSGRTGKLYFNISNGAAPAEAFNIAADKTATFAGAIAIGNTVAAAASVASTHKVTISIGGVTYYLLASNV